MGRAVGAVWGTQLLVSRVFARSFVYKVHFGVFSRAFSDDFHDENKLATSILAERGGGVQIPCFTLPINFASKWPASVAFGRLSPCVRGEKPKHLCEKHTHKTSFGVQSLRYTRDIHMLPIRYAARVTAYSELSKSWLHRSILEAKPRRGWGARVRVSVRVRVRTLPNPNDANPNPTTFTLTLTLTIP